MNITIKRDIFREDLVAGVLYVDGMLKCFTLERRCECLKVGRYELRFVQCTTCAWPMPLVLTAPRARVWDARLRYRPNGDYYIGTTARGRRVPHCDMCRYSRKWQPNDPLQAYCPMLRPSSTIHNAYDGRICIGIRQAGTLLLRCRETWLALYNTMEEALLRGEEISLKIEKA